MNQFVDAIQNQESRTENGMKARKSTANALVDLFFAIGASRGKDIIPSFVAAYVENPELACRIALWARDVRGGAGERKVFRDILLYLSERDGGTAARLVAKIPEIGRFDDVFATKGVARKYALELIKAYLDEGNGLTAKWMPRKGPDAADLRKYLGLTPKQYRKMLVEKTKVVETQMCSKDWDNINFNHVPSLAASRYKKAFHRHTPKYGEWVQALIDGKKDVKVNAGAVFPYDVLKGFVSGYNRPSATEAGMIQAQWDALPNYVGDANILPLVDVSGSMTCRAGGSSSKSVLTCLDVSVSLGLYLADKNQGVFKDTFLTFSSNPRLLTLKGNIIQKIGQMHQGEWGMSTDLHAAFNQILKTAVDHNVPKEDMPKTVLILSDMQFNQCIMHDDSAMEMIQRKYKEAGYDVPTVVFWNLNSAYDNVPVKFDTKGAALVSGFSPSIVKSVLSSKDVDPVSIMMETIMQDRYNF